MGFKSDREFLRNITVGAVGNRKIVQHLNAAGFRIIELERGSLGNKIWGTKIKRLRVPDLLCLRSGTRIESRAKGKLKIIMSHAQKNPDRAWDKGLRDSDLVACIHCRLTDDVKWEASGHIAFFRVGDLRATRQLAKVSRMKSAAEGSEVFLTWPAVAPNQPGQVLEVSRDAIRSKQSSGRIQSYSLVKRNGTRLHPHVSVGDEFGAGDRIIASVLPEIVQPHCEDCPQYDFVEELEQTEPEVVYAAVKALGYLPELRTRSFLALKRIVVANDDFRIRLEAAASLARLNDPGGLKYVRDATAASNRKELRMEAVLILGEFAGQEALNLLAGIARERSNDAELRAAAAWGMPREGRDLIGSSLLDLLADADENVALHSIVAASRLVRDHRLDNLLDMLGEDDRQSAGIVKAVLASSCEFVPTVVEHLKNATGSRRQWLLYLIASKGRAACETYLREHVPQIVDEVAFFWDYHRGNWTARLDVADQTEFLLAQVLE